MRWFKHISVSHTDETMSELTDNFGAEGYGVWWIILEKIAQVMDESDRCFARYSVKVWANSAKISAKKFQNITGFLEKKQSLILELDKDILTINCPKLLKYRDEWTERKNKESKKSRDQLPSDSRETPAQDTDTELELDTDKDKEKILSLDPSDPPSPLNFNQDAKEVLIFLNKKSGKNFEPVKSNLDFIVNRMKEGGTVTICKQIIALKCRAWLTDEKMKYALRPKTLFNKTNFWQYKGELIPVEDSEQ